MEKKHRFFIYDRQEVGILLLLGVMVAVFAFTLGLHLGKRVASKQWIAQSLTPPAVAPVETSAPSPTAEDQVRNQASAGPGNPGDETLSRALHEEVARTGLKIDQPRQIHLPDKPVSENSGATAEQKQAAEPEKEPAKESATATEPEKPEEKAEAPSAATPVKYVLQVGSYPNEKEAQGKAQNLAALGLKTAIREAEVQGKGHRYRLFVGAYANKEDAVKDGMKFQSQGLIESFILASAKALGKE